VCGQRAFGVWGPPDDQARNRRTIGEGGADGVVRWMIQGLAASRRPCLSRGE
jgi:hypothetical protein